MLRRLVEKGGLFLASLRNNPDYAGAIAFGYGAVAMQIVAQLLLVPIYISSFGKFGFGTLMVLLAFANCARLGMVWFAGPMLRALGKAYAASDKAEFRLAANAFRVGYIFYGVLSAAVLALIGIYMPDWLTGQVPDLYADTVRQAFLGMAIYVFTTNWLTAEVVVLAARRRQVLSQASQLVSIAVFVFLAVPLMFAGAGLAAVVACLVAGSICALGFCLYFAWRDDWGLPALPCASFAAVLRQRLEGNSLAFCINGVLVLLIQADTLIVGIIGGAETAAEFVLVWKIAEVLILMLWRISESLQPEIINMEMTGDQGRISRLYSRGTKIVGLAALAAGVAYAVAGNLLVRLWVGQDAAPDGHLPFILAGGAILWLSIARLPGVIAYSLARLRALNTILFVEAAARIAIIIALFPRIGFLAPLVAINVVHGLGLSWVYFRAGRAIVRHDGSQNVRSVAK